MMTITTSPSIPVKCDPLLLNQRLQTPDQWHFFQQCDHALKIAFKQGKLAGIAETVFFAGATAYTALSAVWELMGSAYSFKELYDAGHTIGRELGDIGGWTSLAAFDFLALKYFIDGCIAEANFLGLKTLCQQVLKENFVQHEQMYQLIINRLDVLNSKGLFHKCVAERILMALEIVGKPSLEKRFETSIVYQEWVVDAELEPFYREIAFEYKKKCSLWHYFHRCMESFKTIGEARGLRGRITSLTMGVAFPLSLLALVVCTVIGEVKLGQQVIGEHEDLPAYGHLGEWLSNIVQALGVAGYTHLRYMLKPGDCYIMEQLIRKALTKVQDHPIQYDRLCEMGSKEQLERGYKSKGLDFVEFKLKNTPPLGTQLV